MRARGSNLRQPRCSSCLARCCDLRHRDAGSARSSTTRPLSTKPRHSCARGQAFGPIDAAVIALMPELGNLSPKAAAALVGLAPFNTESGRLKSNRSISGGQMARAQCVLHGRTRCCPSKTRLAASTRASAMPVKPPSSPSSRLPANSSSFSPPSCVTRRRSCHPQKYSCPLARE